MSLPAWVTDNTRFAMNHMNGETEAEKQLIKALAIAWEALEKIEAHQPQVWDVERALAQEAMRRIESLGESK